MTQRNSLRRTLQLVAELPRLVLIGLVRAYQLVVSPHLPSSCRYTPSCSEYAIGALQRYGACKGAILSVHRLLRCHPWGGHGYDPPHWYGEGDDDSMEPGGTSNGAAAESPSAQTTPSELQQA